MKSTDWTKYLNHNVIVVPADPRRDDPHPREYKVLQVDPEGKFVKMQNGRGKGFWTPVDEYKCVSSLGSTP